MRSRTRNLVLATLGLVVLLLALVAGLGLLKSGAPYYVTATPVEGDHPAVNATALSERRFPYTTGALRNAGAEAAGWSDPYWRGYVGLKEAFAHSPFDEFSALRGRSGNVTDGEAIYVRTDAGLFRAEIVREGRL